MADVNVSTFTVVQNYGGLKKAVFTVTAATAADVLKFSNVSGIKMVVLQDSATGSAFPYTITGTGDIDVTVGAGASADALVGEITYLSN